MSHHLSEPVCSPLQGQATAASTKSRRTFLGMTLAAGCMASSSMLPSRRAEAIEPFSRLSPGRLRLSLAAYSMRDYLKTHRDGWDLHRFVDYCHELGVPGAELTSYYFPNDVTNEYLVDLKQHCHRRGITISGGAIANDFCQLDAGKVRADIESTKRWIDRYAVLGAGVIRIFAGTQPKDSDWDSTLTRCATAIEEVADYAHGRGIYLGLENHGGVTAKAEGLLELVRRVRSKGFGVNLDSGNFRSTDDPYAELSAIAPYAVNAQFKVEMFPNGKREEADVGRVLRILKDSNYSGWVALEYEAADPPLEAIPKWVRTLQLELGKLTS
ncbi:MAG: sugar phosphate isomerase/epimerase family protein [Pirellula sp.]